MPNDQSDDIKLDWQAADEAVRYLSAKWTLAVVAELASAPKGHNDLARATGVLDHKSLDRALHRLESAGLVDRAVRDPERSAPRVIYQLTERAYSLLPLICKLASWWHAPSLAARMGTELLYDRIVI